MIDFSTLQGLTIPEGVVTQIARDGVVLWKVNTGKPVILEVEKQIITSYAADTTYENEECIVLQIYPKSNGTVSVTYGTLTKTITDTSGAESPNSQVVFFGTFNGVSDSVTTPTSGTLTIEGDYDAFGCGRYSTNGKGTTNTCHCITNVIDWGTVDKIPNNAFQQCNLTLTSLPSSITSIGNYAFDYCTNLALTSLPSGVTSIGSYAFRNCLSLNITELPEGLISIGNEAFYMPTKTHSEITMNTKTITFPSTLESIGESAFRSDDYGGDSLYYTYLANAIMLAENPPVLGDKAFGVRGARSNGNQLAYMQFIVPKGCAEKYKSAESWGIYNQFCDIVEAN